jgi:GH18 family chitinase
MSPAHVNVFAKNIVNFISKNNLDGVDIDWEVSDLQRSQGHVLLNGCSTLVPQISQAFRQACPPMVQTILRS